MSNNTYTTSGNGNWTCPPYVDAADIELWGAGGGGGGSNNNSTAGGAGSGGGGAYAKISVTGLVAGNLYPYSVGAGGAGGAANNNGVAGGATSFTNNSGGNTSTILSANGGGLGINGANTGNKAGVGGAATTGAGVTSYAGGNGANNGGTSIGAGGGAAAGNANAGASATNQTGATGANGGGSGGNGGARNANGVNGVDPGGGGGGAGRSNTTTGANRVGGTGANGQVIITWSENATLQPIRLAASGNIAASGENTTAQLTAPSGKTTSDFVTGRMQDDENPADSIDITTDDYTELEWSIKVTSYAAINDVYQFRVTKAGTALDTYTVTPSLTVSGSADKTGADSGTLSESGSLAVTLAGTDSATLTDATTLLDVIGTDSGAATDASELSFGFTDSGTATDSTTSIDATLESTDSAELSEATAFLKDASDSATLDGETSALAAEAPVTDSSTLTDSTTALEAVLDTSTDSATLSEASQTSGGAVNSIDDATLTDATTANDATLASTDSATLAAEGSNLGTGSTIAGTDSAIVSEARALAATLDLSADSGTQTEGASALAAARSTTDTGTLTDVTTLLDTNTPIAGTDTGTLSEASAIVVTGLASTDSATVSDSSTVSTGTSAHAVSVGNGYTDVTPRQMVRTAANRLYIASWKFDYYPWGLNDGSNIAQTLRMYKADQDGVPATFTRLDQAHEPAGVVSWAMAVDGNDVIHVVWMVRATWVDGHPYSWDGTDNYLRYAQFDTATDTWGTVTNIETAMATTERGQGDELVSIAIDANGIPHIVYLKHDGTRRRVTYRNRSGGSWSAATTVDDQSFATDERCWHPGITFDTSGRIVVTWQRGTHEATTTGRYFVRVYSGGSWGTTHDVTGAAVWCGIDTGTPIYISPDNRYHTAFLSTGKHIRYYYSDDLGSTWTANNPGSGTYAGDDPAVGPGPGGTVRVYAHSAALPPNIVYFQGSGGSASWSSATSYIADTGYDCSVNVRWTQFWQWYPGTHDIAYWKSDYPTNALYIGSDIDTTDLYGTDSGTLAESSDLVKTVTGTDSATLAEAKALTFEPAGADSATASEAAGVLSATAQAGTDSGTLTDISAQAAVAWSRSDSGALAEGAAALVVTIAGSETWTLTESSSLTIFEMLSISGSDSLTLTDAADAPSVTITLAEALTFSEAAALEVTADGADDASLLDFSLLNTGEAPISVDGFALNESSTLTVVLAVTDGVTFSEWPAAIEAVFSATDAALVTFGETSALAVAAGALKVYVDFSTWQPGVDFATRQPGMTITAR